MATVDVRGNAIDIDKAINEITDLVGQTLTVTEPPVKVNVPDEVQEFAPIDWQAAARESVNTFK